MTNKKDNSRYQFNTNDINESRYVIEMIYRDIRGNRRLHRDIYEMNNNELHEKINGLIPDKASVSQIKMHSEKYKEEIKNFVRETFHGSSMTFTLLSTYGFLSLLIEKQDFLNQAAMIYSSEEQKQPLKQ